MGPTHAWHNRSNTTARLLLVFIAATEAQLADETASKFLEYGGAE